MKLEPDVAHQGLVLRPPHVLLLPASVAEVVEAGEVPGSRRYQLLRMKEENQGDLDYFKQKTKWKPAEVGALLHAAEGAESVLRGWHF